MELEFNTIFITILLGIIVLLFLKSEKCECYIDDMYMHESSKVLNDCEFSLECCPSVYSNDKGCLCTNKKTDEALSTRGYNKTSVDGFGY